MERHVAEVLRDALALPAEARAALIDSLIGSLEPAIDEGAEEAWKAEIDRRLQQIDSGATTLVPWQAARRHLRHRLER
ncbi:MAG: addiction module protein [Bryobacteraceae bacterium]